MKKILLTIAVACSASSSCSASFLYWTNSSPNGNTPVVLRANLDGSGQQTLLSSGNGGSRSIALDVANNHFYVGYSNSLFRYDLDGSNPTTIIGNTGFNWDNSDLAIDSVNDVLYWTNSSPNGNTPVVLRANLDGSGQQTLLSSGNGGSRSIALDVANNHFYVGYSNSLFRYDLDGSNPTTIIGNTGFNWVNSDLGIDSVNDVLYWTNSSPNGNTPVVLRANLDGSGRQTLLSSGNGGSRSIALDVANNHFYVGYSNSLFRYDLDGSNPTTIIGNTGLNWVNSDLAIDSVPEPANVAYGIFTGFAALSYRFRRKRTA
jgi:hypothetical protein